MIRSYHKFDFVISKIEFVIKKNQAHFVISKNRFCDIRTNMILKILILPDSAAIYELRHDISNNTVCATSKASDQPTHTHGLIIAWIRAFASRLNIL